MSLQLVCMLALYTQHKNYNLLMTNLLLPLVNAQPPMGGFKASIIGFLMSFDRCVVLLS
jgi:hypothetical protein